MTNYTENQIAPVAYEIIRANPGIRTSSLIDRVREEMRPDGEDLEILAGRNDDKFSQKVRNLKSHNTFGNKIHTIGEHNRKWYTLEDYQSHF